MTDDAQVMIRVDDIFRYAELESREEWSPTGCQFWGHCKTFDSRTGALLETTEWTRGVELTYS